MDIGQAMIALKQGKRVYREGWNARKRGLDMWLWYNGEKDVKQDLCDNPVLCGICDGNGGHVGVRGCIAVNYGDGTVSFGWSAWDEDLLADDWVIGA